MSFWTSNKSIGVCWSPEGDIRAVAVEPHADGYVVVNHWQSEGTSTGDLSERLPQALRGVGADEASRVIVGGPDSSAATYDLRVPRLTGETLRNALLFELRKICPLPNDQLAWGYRIIPGSTAGNTQAVRLFYLRDAEWSRWVENVSQLNRSVDVLFSSRMALDPAFADACLQLDSDTVLQPPVEGVRREGTGTEGNVPVLGAPADPLAHPRLDPGPLRRLNHDEARMFIPAILLAAYGVGGDLKRDRRTLPPFPDELIPKRHRVSRGIAALLLVYVVMVAFAWGGMTLKKGLTYRRQLTARVRSVEEKITKLEEARDSSETEKDIRESLRQIAVDDPSMSAALGELTDSIPETFWVSKMTWTAGKLELDVKGSETDLSFVSVLESSPLLKEVELTKRTVDSAGNLSSAEIRMLIEQQNDKQDQDLDRL